MGEQKRRADAIDAVLPGAGDVSLTVMRCHGVVVQGSPLDPQPLRATLFGKPNAPIERELVELREVDRLLQAIAPHALLLADAADAPELQDAVRSLRAVFAPPAEPQPPSLLVNPYAEAMP